MRAARGNQPVIWRDVVNDLRSFKRYADEVARWPRRLPLAEFGDFGSESPYRQTVRELAFAGHSPNDEDDPTRVGSAFHHWLAYNAPGPRGETPLQQLRRNLRKSAAGVLEQGYDEPEFVRLGGLKQSMKMYVDALNEAVEQAAPERFSYKGFKVLNPNRVWESNLVNVFDGIDYLVSLFKKRGVEPLLREGVKSIKVVENAGGGAAGKYNPQSKQIIVVAGVTTSKLKMLDNFMHEVFVHEFGHHVHMTHMDAAGRESWDSGWEFVDKAQADLNSKISVTPADRHRFFDLIERSGWSPQKAGRKVKGLDRLKYLMWLYKPMVNQIISTPNQVRLTDYGKALFDFFRDPEGAREVYIEWGNSESQADRMVERRTRMYKDTLGLTSDYARFNHPMLDEASVEKVRAEDRSVDDALDALGIPTAYGRTNVLEDFAETFVLWMVHPDRLSEQARNRMGRALWLSGFYGKPVMRVARDQPDPLVDWDASKVRYRAKVSGDGVVVWAYYGRKRVGGMSAIPKSYPENNNTLCDDDVRALVDQHPHLVVREWQRSDGTVWRQIPTLVVYKAFIEDETYHGRGIGKGMYEMVMREWFKKNGPFVFIPFYCTIGSGTSSQAKRVWDSLSRRFPSVGHAVAVLKPPKVASAFTTRLAGDSKMASSAAKRVAARWMKQSKNLPKNVERYVQEGKDQGLDEGEAWAVAWSRYCRWKNPDSPHCKKDSPSDYFPNQGKKKSGGHVEKQAGLLKAPPAMVKEVSAWAVKTIAEKLYADLMEELEWLEEEYNEAMKAGDRREAEFNRKQIEEYDDVAAVLMRYARDPKAHPGKVTKKFKPNLSGWPYKVDEGNLPDLPVTVVLANKDWKYDYYSRAIYDFDNMLMAINASLIGSDDPKEVEAALKAIPKTIRHELQHYVQDIMSLGLPEGAKPGQPKPRVRDTSVGPFGSYTLNDKEYHPLLTDEVESFVEAARGLSRRDLNQAVNDWTAGRSRLPGYDGVNKRFWSELSRNRGKWQEATKTFYKEVMDALTPTSD